MSVHKKQICPKCNGGKIAEIVYGYVKLDENGEKELEDGKIILGGCIIEQDQPSLYCHNCQFQW